MEIIAIAFGAALIISHLERKEARALQQPQPCRICEDTLFYDKRTGWLHSDGEQYAQTPGIRYDRGRPAPLHTAIPLSLGGLIA